MVEFHFLGLLLGYLPVPKPEIYGFPTIGRVKRLVCCRGDKVKEGIWGRARRRDRPSQVVSSFGIYASGSSCQLEAHRGG